MEGRSFSKRWLNRKLLPEKQAHVGVSVAFLTHEARRYLDVVSHDFYLANHAMVAVSATTIQYFSTFLLMAARRLIGLDKYHINTPRGRG